MTMATSKKSKAKAKPIRSSKEEAEHKRKLFVEAYIANGGNATQAAIQAGYSERTAYSAGARLLKSVEVSTQLEQRRTAVLSKLELTTESVLRSLAQAVHFDPRKLYDEHGNLKPITELDDDTAMALSGVEVMEEFAGRGEKRELVGYTKKVKWLDKNAARDQAMKHLGMFREDNNQRNPLSDLPRDMIKDLVAKLGGTTP